MNNYKDWKALLESVYSFTSKNSKLPVWMDTFGDMSIMQQLGYRKKGE